MPAVEARILVTDALDWVLLCEGGVAVLGRGVCEGKMADLGLPVPDPVGAGEGDVEAIRAKGFRRCDMVGALDVMFLE